MRHRSLFIKLFLLLIMFITIPVITIASIISYQTTNYSVDVISKSTISKLKASDKQNRLIADYLSQRALEMTNGESIRDLEGLTKYQQISSDPTVMMKLFTMQKQLNDLAISNDSLHSVYLYIDDSDFILTSNQSTQEISKFADSNWIPTYNALKKTNAGSNWMSTRVVRLSKNSEWEFGASSKVITYFYIFTPYTTSVRGVLIFNIYEPYIREMANDRDSLNNGHIEIINTNGYVVSDINDDMVGKSVKSVPYIQKIRNNPLNEGYLMDNTEGEKHLISFYKSDYNNWIYLGVFQADTLLSKINGIRTFILIICSVLIVAGILISYLASKKIYNPLSNLLHDIRQKKGIDIKSDDGDMAILAKAYDNLLKDRDRLSFITENKDSNKTVYLDNLLKGNKVEYLDQELTGIDLSYGHFICSVMQIDRYSMFESAYTKEQQEYMRMFILKISEELLNTEMKCAGMVYEKNRIALIVNYDDSLAGNIKVTLKDMFDKIQTEIGKITDNTISIGIGTCQDCIEGICDSLHNALEALRYKLINGYGSVSFWEDTYRVNTRYYYPFVHETHIFNVLNAGIKDKLETVIAEFIQEIKNNSEMHYDNVTQIFNQLIGNTIKYLLDCNCSVSMIFGDNYSLYTVLAAKENLDEIKEWLIDIFTKIAEYLEKEWSLSKNHFERAVEYIHKNYRTEIDINEVAKYAGISYSHLRKVFREEAGDNILNYINNLRIQESKRLLRVTDMMIKDISVFVGYNCEKSFVRFFKKYEGVVPGDFRASNRNALSS
jgi:AraC-like DNA-binding protein